MINAFRMINLEDDLPTVEQAMKRLVWEIRTARQQNIHVLKIIHGFGSSGRGGKIRPATRKQLEKLMRSGHVQYFIPGEKFSIFDEATRRALQKFTKLSRDSDLERHNNGITIVIL